MKVKKLADQRENRSQAVIGQTATAELERAEFSRDRQGKQQAQKRRRAVLVVFNLSAIYVGAGRFS